MRNLSLLLLTVAMTMVLAQNHTMKRRPKRELLRRSKRRWVLSTIEIVEEDPGPFPKEAAQMYNDKIGELKAKHKFRILGMGVDKDPRDVFSIDEATGMVMVHQPINREEHEMFHIEFDILDFYTDEPLDRTLSFDVEVQDINDNIPYFQYREMNPTVKENVPSGLLPVQLQVYDLDQEKTENSTVTISVLSQEPKTPKLDVFQMNGSRVGQLRFDGCFDYDKASKYKIIIQAKDHGKPPLSSTSVINLSIIDTNTHAPTFKTKEYHGQVLEMEVNKEVLRIAVEDKDQPNTPGWNAQYYFITGNEDNNYKIETDPKTNEGILTLIKGKDYERTTFTKLQIGVKNEEKMFVCGADKKPAGAAKEPPGSTVDISIKVIDVNDPPVFVNNQANIYLKEEEEPGKVLFKPQVTDEDSDVEQIRFKLLSDPAGWVSIDEKTGEIKAAKKMDRESPFVDGKNAYKVLVTAVDNGEPPATATGTILIHLGDINDNFPILEEKIKIMCVNKDSKIMVPAKDLDLEPYAGPFTFTLGGDDDTLSETWKLDPATGEAAGLILLRSLLYGNYSVPLIMQEQQGMLTPETLEVVICDCGDGDECRDQLPLSTQFGPAGIGLLFAGLLLFLILLLAFMCECGRKFKHIPILQDEGNQTLIKYNDEGGGAALESEPTLLLPPVSVDVDVVDVGLKQSAPLQPFRQTMEQVTAQNSSMYQSAQQTQQNMMSSEMTSMAVGGGQLQLQHQANDTLKSLGGRMQNRYSTWNTSRMTTANRQQHNSARYSRSFSMLTDQHITDHIERRLYMIEGDHVKTKETQGDYPVYQLKEYAYEGEGSTCQSLDELSLANLDDLGFLKDLGSKFKTLGAICQEDMQKKSTQL